MEFFRFEISRRLRQPMVWIFFAVNFVLILGALNSESVTVGGDLPNVNGNAPWVVQQQVMFMTLIGLLVTTAFVNTAAVRDFSSKFDQMLFTKPITKLGYLGGRFLGSVLMACIPLLGVLLAVYLTGQDISGNVKVGPHVAGAYLWAVLLFIIPNTLFAGAVTFAAASLTRSQVAGFVAALGLLMLYIVAGSLTSDLDTAFGAALLDPFGFTAFSYETKYWTSVERNTQYLTFADAAIGLNRLVWVGVSLGVFAVTYLFWSFETRTGRAGGRFEAMGSDPLGRDRLLRHSARAPDGLAGGNISSGQGLAGGTSAGGTLRGPYGPRLAGDGPTALRVALYAIRTELAAILSSRVFLVVMAFAVLNMSGSIFSIDESYGTGNYPVTYLMIDAIRGSLYLFLGAIVMYYAGELVWRERDAHMAELIDAAPVATWVAPTAKFVALSLVPLVVLVVSIGLGVLVQAVKGYTDFDLSQYVAMLIGLDWPVFVAFAGLALLLQAILDNKYLGYFAFLVLLIVTTFGMEAMGVHNNLFVFGSTPAITFTAFNRLAPYTGTVAAYTLYWGLVTLLLVAVAALFWVRGRGHTWRNRAGLVAQRFDGGLRLYSLGLLAAIVAFGGFLYYQTSVVNEVLSDEEWERLSVTYEQTYERFAERPSPTITAADYDVELYPAERRVEATVTLDLLNKTDRPVDTLLVSGDRNYDYAFDIPGAERVEALSTGATEVYAFAKPLAPGQSLRVVSVATYAARGLENEVSNTGIVPNGSFVSSESLAPHFGYRADAELSDPDDREKYELPAKRRAPLLPEGDCHAACRHTYLTQDADWVRLSATVTTSADQIAVTPGTLVSETTDEASGRRTFRYEVETPVMHFFSVVSGRYEVARERWGDVDLEVYHLPEHAYNVDKMMASMRTSLEFYSEAFGAYPHRQARIIEFPRYASFAQAFPGTMPYSESIGFIADLKDATDIDMVTYVVAHEMAHQWWAHQVIGAGVQGATMLSETFAQYSALRVQERVHGRQQMRKFLAYEMDKYLKGRGRERLAERPLMLDEGQGYNHYNKGAVVMYALAEYIGRDSVDAALRSFVERFGGAEPPYPTSRQFVDEHLRPRVPDSLQYVVDDWFETITLYSNRVVEASARTLGDDGGYEVTFTVDIAKVRADSLGEETAVPIDGDYIDVGVYRDSEDADVLGGPLWLERVRFEEAGERTFTVKVGAEPAVVAIDGGALLVDRLADDNVLDVDLE